ncbi:hypothetical protein KAV79_09325, partial [Candidatus Aerophobetes bacterium]|nr:hypothetical protein [Candidatus Aerophobetes bacterium]
GRYCFFPTFTSYKSSVKIESYQITFFSSIPLPKTSHFNLFFPELPKSPSTFDFSGKRWGVDKS